MLSRRFCPFLSLGSRLAKQLAICLALLMLSQTARADNGQLVGLGLHQETGRDIYLGALYVPEDEPRPADIGSLAGPRTMEYRVVARRTSIRSLLGSMLLQSEIATGRPPSASTTEFADALLSKIKGSLYSGDSLKIELTPDEQTIAKLNGHRLARVDDPEVANYLLIGWLDERGPSTVFRSGLLASSIDSALRERLEASQADDQRNAEVAQWFQPSVEAESARTEQIQNTLQDPVTAALPENEIAPSNTEETPAVEQESANGTSATVSAPASTPAPSDSQDEQTQKLAQSTNMTATQPETQQPDLDMAQLDLGDALGQSADAPSLDSLGDLPNPTTSLALNSQDLGDIQLDTEVLALGVREYSRRLSAFHNNLVARVYRAIKYPKRAIRRSLEGRLELDITLRKTGELVAVSIAETSGHSLLDDAAVEAAEAALAEPTASLDVVAIAEFGNRDGRVVVPVPVSFQLMKK